MDRECDEKKCSRSVSPLKLLGDVVIFFALSLSLSLFLVRHTLKRNNENRASNFLLNYPAVIQMAVKRGGEFRPPRVIALRKVGLNLLL